MQRKGVTSNIITIPVSDLQVGMSVWVYCYDCASTSANKLDQNEFHVVNSITSTDSILYLGYQCGVLGKSCTYYNNGTLIVRT